MKVLLYIIYILICFPYSLRSRNEGDLIAVRNYPKNKVTLYYVTNKQKTDSITLNNLNFKVDSLTRINDSTWYYVFSTRAGSNLKIRKNAIFRVLNNKIKPIYAGYLIYSLRFDEKYNSESKNSLYQDGEYKNLFYILDKSIFGTSPKIIEYYYSGKVPDTGNGKKTIYNLKYDAKNQIIYNRLDSLKGVYYIINQNTTKTAIINEQTYFLKFQHSCFVYYNKKWFEINAKRKLVSFE
ncbi:MAG: hypothetical protein JNK50_01010 [Bacteroidia bacterium]|nr:hypothetical protein [Bacteroidia bacterium]